MLIESEFSQKETFRCAGLNLLVGVIGCRRRDSQPALFKELKSRKAEWADNEVDAVYHVGDCHTPRFIQLSVFEAHRMAREFESDNPQYPLPFIREKHIWGSPTYPSLG